MLSHLVISEVSIESDNLLADHVRGLLACSPDKMTLGEVSEMLELEISESMYAYSTDASERAWLYKGGAHVAVILGRSRSVLIIGRDVFPEERTTS